MPVPARVSRYPCLPPRWGLTLGLVAHGGGETCLFRTSSRPRSHPFWLLAASPLRPSWFPVPRVCHLLRATSDLLLVCRASRTDTSRTPPAFPAPQGSQFALLLERLVSCQVHEFQNTPRQCCPQAEVWGPCTWECACVVCGHACWCRSVCLCGVSQRLCARLFRHSPSTGRVPPVVPGTVLGEL